jgi:hypothetical protein
MRNILGHRKDYDDLRKDIIEVKIDYKSWMRSLKVIAIAVTVVLSILAYFGYDKIDTLEKTILDRTNSRLAKTDTLLSKIDEKRIDAINKRITEKETEYNSTLKSIEKVINQNKIMEEKILSVLPNNTRVNRELKSFMAGQQDDIFETRQLQATYNRNQKTSLYLIFDEKYDLKNVDVICLQMTKDNVIQKDYYYAVEQRFNKIEVTFDLPSGNYKLEFGFLTKSNNLPTFHRIVRNIKII